MKAQLLLSAHLSLPVWDLIAWLQRLITALSSLWFILSPLSLDTVSEHRLGPDCCPVPVFFLILFQPSPPSNPPVFLILYPVFWQFYFSDFHCFFTSSGSFPRFCSTIIPYQNCSFRSSFPLFSLLDNEIGKSTPVTCRVGLPESCRWMLHGALDWCMCCHTRDFSCMMNTANKARLGLFTFTQTFKDVSLVLVFLWKCVLIVLCVEL